MRILVAEDDRICRRMLEATLARWGYEVQAVEDGTAAWEALQGGDAPPLAIVDWMMPGMDGPEICRRLRAECPARPVYVILLTARHAPEDVAAGLRAGADDFVAKPFEVDELHARVQVGVRVVELQRGLIETARELRERGEHLRAIVDHAQDGIVTIDAHDGICSFNPAAERIFGYAADEILGRGIATVMPGPLAVDLESEGNGGGVYREVEGRRKDGSTIPIELALSRFELGGTPLFTVILRDVSERKRNELEIRHTQRLESVGRLAAGIAHEINTPIQFIGDNTRFLAEGFASLAGVVAHYRSACAAAGPLSEETCSALRAAEAEADLPYVETEVPRAIEQTLEGVNRVATIVRAMKEFAHPEQAEKVQADLNQALRSTLTVARNELKYVADVEMDLGELPMVTCHLGDLNQVFLNLLVNAAHAIADVVRDTGTKGSIRVQTRQDGDDVVIAISDTGCGIPERIRGRIFDPFFTTKEVGRGTGQGLALARAIVGQKHGGSLTFASEEGRGTTFLIRLPVGHAPRTDEAAA